MIAAQDPLVGRFGSRNARHHVVEGLAIPVEAYGEMRFGLARTHAIGQRQSAAPVLGNSLALKSLQEWRRIFVGDGEHRDLRDSFHLVERNQFRALRRADSWGLR